MSQQTLSWIGIWLLVGGAVVIILEGVLAGVWTVAVGQRAQELSERMQSEQKLLEEDVQRLRLALEETQLLWRPYARALKWLRHPLVIALVQSYARRRVL